MGKENNDRLRAIFVIIVLMAIVYLAYFWQFQISLDEARGYMPGFIDSEIEKVVSKLPPEKRNELKLPVPEVKYQADLQYDRVVLQDEFNATAWILNNTKKTDKFVADIFSAEQIMGMTTRVSTVGGDWANAPNPIGKMANTTEIFKTDSAQRANELARAENAGYVFAPHRDLYTGWRVPISEVRFEKFDDPAYFEKVYGTGNVTIYRVL